MKQVYGLIAMLSVEFSVGKVCGLLEVSRSAYYDFGKKNRQGASRVKQGQARAVAGVFWEHKRRYGTRRIVAELKAKGMETGRHRVRVLMQGQDLKAIQPKSFVPKTTDSTHGKRNSPNLLLDEQGQRHNPTTAPNQVWVSDLTYLPLSDGSFGYLVVWLDLFSRRVVGWQVEDPMQESLLRTALQKALSQRQPPPGLIAHSDRGGQYVSARLRRLMRTYECRQSMSRADDPYDNAFCESFFSRFKAELLEKGTFLSLEDAKTEVFEFIESYYNRKRRHSALGYLSPHNFEQLFYKNQN
jgi:transposase InsO family protein